MKTHYIPLFCITTFAAIFAFGCAGETEISQIPALKTNASAKPETPNASEEKKSAESIPKDFPSDIHIVDGANSTNFNKVGEKNNLILKYHGDSNEGLIKRYFEGMEQQGWAQLSSSKLQLGTVTSFTKESRKCAISIGAPRDQSIMVAIIY